MNKKITVLTPTYNRAYCLSNAYESMKKQKNKDFIWSIIDDGSIDNTAELIGSFKQNAPFEIKYIKTKNGGKHRALNIGISNTNTDLIIILDSDDYLTDNAIETIMNYYNKVENFDGICGFSFLRIKQNGEVIGKKFPQDYYIDNHISCRFNKDIGGDKAEVFFTEILKKYPFPEIEGEKFLTEAIVWSKIGRDYNTIYINEPLIVCEYLPDGLTNAARKLALKNPKGMALFYRENSDEAYRDDIRKKYTARYIAYSLLSGKSMDDIKKEALSNLSSLDIENGKSLSKEYYKELEKYENIR